MVDCIRVYSKTKDEFGWPEHLPTPSISTGKKAEQKGEKQEEGEVVQAAVSRSLSPVDRYVPQRASCDHRHVIITGWCAMLLLLLVTTVSRP